MPISERELHCSICGKLFIGHYNTLYCPECKKYAHRQKAKEYKRRVTKGNKTVYVKRCLACGQMFETGYARSQICSPCRLGWNEIVPMPKKVAPQAPRAERLLTLTECAKIDKAFQISYGKAEMEGLHDEAHLKMAREMMK